jgi:hypothetical protein
VQGVSELADLGGQAALARVQDAPVRVGEARDVEGQELLEGVGRLVEAGLELPGGRTQWRGGRRGQARRGAPRIPEQRLVGRRVGGGLPGGEEGVGLTAAQPVADDGLGQARLLAARQSGERDGRRGREPARVDVRGHRGRQPSPQEEAARDPAAAAAEQPADLGRREVIVVGQGAHHARLVHRAHGAAGRVRLEQAGLGHDADGVLDHHRHVGVALARPLSEPLEAVEDLVAAVVASGHAQRQRGERTRPIGARASQRRQARGEARDRYLDHDRSLAPRRGRRLRQRSTRPHRAPPRPSGLDAAGRRLAKWNAGRSVGSGWPDGRGGRDEPRRPR